MTSTEEWSVMHFLFIKLEIYHILLLLSCLSLQQGAWLILQLILYQNSWVYIDLYDHWDRSQGAGLRFGDLLASTVQNHSCSSLWAADLAQARRLSSSDLLVGQQDSHHCMPYKPTKGLRRQRTSAFC